MKRKAFTLIELIIVIVIVGILSVLLFRTLGDMMRANARVQQEKILAQELISIQTSLNNISEQYPYLNHSLYSQNDPIGGWLSTLHLKNDSGETVSITSTGDCIEECYIIAQFNNEENIALTNKEFSKIANVSFKILPIQHYTIDQYESSFRRENMSQPGFWIFGNLTNNLKNWNISKVSYHLQHFINLQLEPYGTDSDNT